MSFRLIWSVLLCRDLMEFQKNSVITGISPKNLQQGKIALPSEQISNIHEIGSVFYKMRKRPIEVQSSPVAPKEKLLDDFIRYKPNHSQLPLLILPNNNLLVYTGTPCYKTIYNYLIAFSEPLNRPQFIHQYRITKFSLYTAMVLEYSAAEIIGILGRLSKNEVLPRSLQDEIRGYMKYAGKVRLQLKDSQYQLMAVKEVGLMLGDMVEEIEEVEWRGEGNIHLRQLAEEMAEEDELEGDRELTEKMVKYKILGDYFNVTRKLILNSIPLIQEYDIAQPTKYQLEFDMNTGLKLRYYQERALKSVIIRNKARSGLIILPCGAGKSLVAILIMQKVKSNAIIFCQSQISVEQWKDELLKWTTILPSRIVRLSGKTRDRYDKKDPVIFITTYSMVGRSRETTNPILQMTQQIEWGLCIADQVHKLPADTFQNVLKRYQFHVKVGLTATPYREDKKIDNLFYMIGPKLFEENWQDLVSQGCLAKPYCVEIRCKMTPKFMDQYRILKGRELLHTANPTKFAVLQYLLKIHESRGDKILVFCDRPHILQYYAKQLKYALIHGQVSSDQRLKIYKLFKSTNSLNVIFLSRVGDTAIDLPCANVAIQIGMHYKSRRQEVQRMGRIMRAKDNPNNEFNAYFYTLVSLDTSEVLYSNTRQKCLIDQGFQYEILLEEELEYHQFPNKHKYIKQLDEISYLSELLINHQEGDLEIEQMLEPVVTKKSLTDSVGLLYRESQP